ncbi:MAG TPA: hypothetical protein VES97_02340 [Solirubrobacteraceae bacterium]|nr:hypothetical protein [Solirubrobacteraceae bacterium]
MAASAALSAGEAKLLYVATAHYMSPRWIEIQARYLRQHISIPYQTWASLEGIDSSHAVHFDRMVEQLGSHSGKLNHLAMEILEQAGDEDLLMFLDGDAFPIADPMPMIRDGLSRAPLIAVRRAENVDSPQPHPCFCVTTAGLWRSLPGDWSAGPTWPGGQGHTVSDVGSLLMRKLELAGLPWVEVLRSNRRNLDPLYFAVYGDVVYHHGAGFRVEKLTATHRAMAPDSSAAPGLPLSRILGRGAGPRRRRAWESEKRARLADESERVFEKIDRGDSDWLSELI